MNEQHNNPATDHHLPTIFWDLRTVVRKTGLSRATIYRYMASGVFPQRRKVGPGRVAWLASEVIAWSRNRPVIPG